MKKITILFLFLSQFALGQPKQLTLFDATLGAYKFVPETLNGITWQNETTFTFMKDNTLWGENVNTGIQTKLVSLDEINEIIKNETDIRHMYFTAYKWLNTDEILIYSNNFFVVINLRQKQIVYTIELPENTENPVFSALGKLVAFTVGDNLFAAFSDGRTIQITNDGGNGIVNGKAVHRNEFGIEGGIFISPCGNFIAFYRKDERGIQNYPLVNYTTRQAEYNTLKYPMAGLTGEQVKLGIFNIKNENTVFMNTSNSQNMYLTNIAWSPNEETIYIAELNRRQDNMQMNIYDILSGEKKLTIFEEKDEKYVEPLSPVLFSKVNNKEFYWLSRRNGWNHIYKYNIDRKYVRQVTSGKWEVTNVLGFDIKEKYLFFEATKESPLENHIYRVEIETGKTNKLTSAGGFHSGLLSPEGGFVIDSRNGANTPNNVDIIVTGNMKNRNIFTAKTPFIDYELGENKLVTILSADGETELYGRLILPVNFDPSKKYPVIVYVYGGPHIQMVTEKWQNQASLWQYYLAQKGYISFTVDNRGTPNRGRDFEQSVHRKLGVLETEDQMKGISYLKSLPYVDTERIGIHGWSYGGFMTLNLMLRNPGVFKVGVAGAPVVDWSMYEIMYGERYMDTPQENPTGYYETNMLNHVSTLQGKLMLVHGMQDDIVVMQHSIKFLNECIEQGKQVDFFVYPAQRHNVQGKGQLHLMEKISSYFFDNL
ncbi:MAG: S9 family peptidase [Bacteroidales bacterium]|jgi:dipeptidyl-peptidase-4|nr:S9 family peptidase [Bacteroidales bacterium]